MGSRTVHVIGTGTIGEPLIGLLCDFKEPLGIDEVTFHKRTPLYVDRSKVHALVKRGARLVSDPESFDKFRQIGLTPELKSYEALERASVVIDCTPSGVGQQNKADYYNQFRHNTLGFLAQGSESGFGQPYARGINDQALRTSNAQFVQIVSCNTHNIAVVCQAVIEAAGGFDHFRMGRFVCMRRANDISQDGSYVPSPQVGPHNDSRFGTHHARDAWQLFQTLDQDMDMYSSALKINTQYMHTLWFSILVDTEPTLDQIIGRMKVNDRIALTYKSTASMIFSFGRDHGHFGRILNQGVVPLEALAVRKVNGGHEVVGISFTSQDGNSLLSSVAAACWFLYPDSYERRIVCLKPYLFDEV